MIMVAAVIVQIAGVPARQAVVEAVHRILLKKPMNSTRLKE
jgi:hypothetical protein